MSLVCVRSCIGTAFALALLSPFIFLSATQTNTYFPISDAFDLDRLFASLATNYTSSLELIQFLSDT
ncbi:hypothetical protein PR003_g26969 [Phytophthora rubi]|uniref:Uncharacterized protein n=1 Tax=Phytophthora rubi TaxID=129364 RepID=A0A6A3HSL8_9STRA|nr:hypothetical protein PR002_g28346 [Phytophthora rubi]KAE8973599.1 hypothetical protein PR001_g26262 [Phytophthora rubi]KAE9284017.1 hypothetical protein PR003_g26969 [Phytophthora rubi]